MRAKDIQSSIRSAHQHCLRSGLKLTEKREQILLLMLESKVPLSPYEVVEKYNKRHNKSTGGNMPANSAYRILDFLAEQNLVHKLHLANKYIACSHIACGHPHSVSQFLICSACHAVKEIMMSPELVNAIQENVDAAGFQIHQPSVELNCLCGSCSE